MFRSGIVIAASLMILAPAPAVEERPYEPDEHTVLLLHMDEGEGQTTADSSPSGLPVRLEAMPRQPVWEQQGKFGRCLRFDGDNADADGDGEGNADGLIFADEGQLQGGEGLTGEAWIKPESIVGAQGILTRTGGCRYNLFAQGAALYFNMSLIADGERQWLQLRTGDVLQADQWQHVAASYDGAMARIYLNGREVASQAATGEPTTGGSGTCIGRDGDLRPGDTTIRGFRGLIDELRISNVARTEFNVAEPIDDAAVPARALQPAPEPELPDRPKYPDPPLPPLVERHVTVTGRVLDAAGAPLAGVLVSDGEQVVATDAEGAYRLEFNLDDLRTVFVTRPRGYQPVDTWFERIPRGVQKTDYQRDFVFAVDPLADREQFSFLSTGDTQFAEVRTFVQLLAEYDQFTAMSGDPAFLTVAGDLTMNGSQWEMDMYREVSAASHIPVYNIFGGHDGNYAREATGSGSVYNYQMNITPAWYSWDYGPVHFVTYVSETSFLTPHQLELQTAWLEADLAAQPPGKPIVITTHQPPANEVMQAWLERYNVIGLLFGHWHQIHSCGYGGVPYLETGPMRGGDWGAFTRRFRVVSFANGELTSEMRICGQLQRLEIVAPQGEVSRGMLPVEIKAYDTTRRISGVTCAIGAEGALVEVPLSRAGDWTWAGTWDATDAPGGEVQMRVTVSDEDGRTWERLATFSVAERQQAGVSIGDDWPSFFRSEHSRVREQPLAPALELAWAANTGGRNMEAVTPVVYGGRVYVGVQNREIGHPGAGVSCYDPADGRLLWHTDTDASICFGLAAGGNLVYAIDSMGSCYAFDAETGVQRWRNDVFPPGDGRSNVASCPVLHDDTLVVFGDSGQCALLDAATGEQRQRHSLAGGWMYYTFPSVHDGRLLVGYRRKAAAFDFESGERLWETEISTGKAASCPVPYRDRIYINSTSLTCLAGETGAELWRQSVPTSGNGISVAVPAGEIVLANGNRLRAFDAESGDLRWEHQFVYDAQTALSNQRQAYAGQSTPAVAGDTVYVGSDDGHLYAFALADGEMLWKHNLGVPLKGSPVISGDALLITDFDGNLYCFAGR